MWLAITIKLAQPVTVDLRLLHNKQAIPSVPLVLLIAFHVIFQINVHRVIIFSLLIKQATYVLHVNQIVNHVYLLLFVRQGR